MKKRNNLVLYIIFVIAIVIIVTVFILFFSVFSKIDKHVYQVNAGSIAFDDSFSYIKTENDSEITQKIDGSYYIYEKKDGKQVRYKIGKQAIIYNETDSNLYLYGKAYQVMTNGDVVTVEGETKIPKIGSTKFYKLADRKYLIVDREIRSVNDNLINAKNYLIVELDKQGNAIFANNEINFKAIKPMILSTSSLQFDIANEKLKINENDEIDLKNIIGSTNEYKEEPPEIIEEPEETEEENYYDKYLTEVVRSVNNLANGVGELNQKSETVGVDNGGKYYDITKWIALRGTSKDTSSITLDYYVFDPANEYQAVFFEVKDSHGISTKSFVNKDGTSHTLRDLTPDSEYVISLGYHISTSVEPIIVDEVTIKTDKPKYSIKVDKILVKEDEEDPENNTYEVYYTLNADKMYMFNTAIIRFYTDNIMKDERVTLCTKSTDSCDENIGNNSSYSGKLELSSLGVENKIVLEDVEVCNSQGTCVNSSITAFYKFFSE